MLLAQGSGNPRVKCCSESIGNRKGRDIFFILLIDAFFFLSNTSSMNISYAKSTSASRFILAFFIIALSTTAGCVRAQDAPQKLTLSQMPFIQATTANSVQIVWNTSLPTRAFIQYSRENNFNNA
jgi:hypothetical protein